jgi:hypothetical protein
MKEGTIMPNRPRPLLAVRLIGPVDVVAMYKQHLLAHLADTFGDVTTCRASTHPAGYVGETHVYLTVTEKEAPPR